MEHVTNRKAHFRTIITWIDGAKIDQFEGVVNGTILTEKRGTGGFGYDPVFLPDGFTKTFAEMSSPEKNEISHRAMAIKRWVDFLRLKSPVSSGHK
jgi:XTP/dITP diphosphohydrolase